MKHYLIHITTQYDGYEWSHQAVTKARTEQSALRKAEKEDWTHDNGIEIQEVDGVQEIAKEHYEVLKQYLVTL